MSKRNGFGTAPVFFTAIATILGAILFLRFGMAVGYLGFWGVILVIVIGHLVTIPTALALSEIATNQKVEGGGEYFIISRSFGLNIGATIGIALYLSQAISVAFYVIAFTEAFSPLFDWIKNSYDIILPRQVISLPAMALLAILILKKGANLGVKALYLVVGILFVSLTMFFLGKTEFYNTENISAFSDSFRNIDEFFIVFAIVFPAFTGMTAGVGLSGDLKKPARSIPLGSISATIAGMIIYLFIVWKFTVSASPEQMMSDQLIMSKIAIMGWLVIPIGLAASTISSALGSIMVAPRTLQALGADDSLPNKSLNRFLSKGKKVSNEPFNATIFTVVIAFVFVTLGSVNLVAEIITMFFLITYGSLNLISFLYHYGGDPSYRPSFRTNKLLSLLGFLLSIWLMFKINTFYALSAIIVMVLLYLLVGRSHKERQGLETIFQGVIFQLSRKIQLFAQRSKKVSYKHKWRPSAICVSADSFKRDKAFELLNWISYKYGFGTYIHLMKGLFTHKTHQESKTNLDNLLNITQTKESNVYLDTMISPSYTSAIAQIIQLPSISGLEYNMIIFEFHKNNPVNLPQIIENYSLVKAGDFDVCILGSTTKNINYQNNIHVWIQSTDPANTNMKVLFSYIILGHPVWKKGKIKIFYVADKEESENEKEKLIQMINEGRIPISKNNIETVVKSPEESLRELVIKRSADAGLTILSFSTEMLNQEKENIFLGYENIGDVLFLNTHYQKTIE